MKTVKKLISLFSKTPHPFAPLIIIKKDVGDAHLKEYTSIEEAISDLENDPNVPSDKLERLKSSLKQLKNKTSITIRNGEII